MTPSSSVRRASLQEMAEDQAAFEHYGIQTADIVAQIKERRAAQSSLRSRSRQCFVVAQVGRQPAWVRSTRPNKDHGDTDRKLAQNSGATLHSQASRGRKRRGALLDELPQIVRTRMSSGLRSSRA